MQKDSRICVARAAQKRKGRWPPEAHPNWRALLDTLCWHVINGKGNDRTRGIGSNSGRRVQRAWWPGYRCSLCRKGEKRLGRSVSRRTQFCLTEFIDVSAFFGTMKGIHLRIYLLGIHRRTTMQRREEENCFMHSRVLFSGLDNDIRHANL